MSLNNTFPSLAFVISDNIGCYLKIKGSLCQLFFRVSMYLP